MRRKNKTISYSFLISLIAAANFFIILPARATGEVIINEIAWMGTTTSATAEWIELYNTAGAALDLTGWILAATDGAPTINLVGIIPAGGYFLLERTSDDSVPGLTADQIYTGALGNTGEQLELKDSSGAIIDSVDQSGGWTAGDNTTKQTMERIGSSWQTSAEVGGTPKALNSSGQEPEVETETPPNSSAPWTPPTEPQVGEVVINELVSDPVDGGQEWIELYNRSDRSVDLGKFTLTEGSGAVTAVSGSLGTYESGRYFVIYSPKGNLNNAGDIVILKYQETIIDQVTYGNWDSGSLQNNAPAAADPNSLARLPDGVDTNNDAIDFSKTLPTPGSKNVLSSSTSDIAADNTPRQTTSIGKLSFNELYPNPPLGDVANEFIELINLSTTTVDLNGWSVADDITTYTIVDTNFTSTFLAPSQIFLLPRPITGIALDNNTSEKITLRAPDGKTVATASYAAPAKEGLVWARNDSNEWLWSMVATPGQINNIKPVNKPPLIHWELPEDLKLNQPLIFDASDTVDPDGDRLIFTWDFGDGYSTAVITPTHVYTNPGKYTLSLTVTDDQGGISTKTKTITLGKINSNSQANISSPTTSSKTASYTELDIIKTLSSRSQVLTTGVVAADSHAFNKDLFLAGSGLQLYLNNGTWPEFVPGDRVQVTGTVSQTKAYGSRLLVARSEDVILLEKTSPPLAKEIPLANLSEDYESWLITVEGEVTRQDKTSVTLLDGDQVLKVNYKNNGPWPNLAVGNKVSATGFLVITNGEFRLWPRDTNDIVLASADEGEVAGASDITITPTNNNWLGYFFIALAVLVILAGWWWEKHGRPKPAELWQKIWSKQKE